MCHHGLVLYIPFIIINIVVFYSCAVPHCSVCAGTIGPGQLALPDTPPPALNIRAGTTGPGRLAGIQGARVPVPVALAQAARLVGIPGDVSTRGIRQFQFTKRLISGPLLGRMGFSDDASFFSPFHNFFILNLFHGIAQL